LPGRTGVLKLADRTCRSATRASYPKTVARPSYANDIGPTIDLRNAPVDENSSTKTRNPAEAAAYDVKAKMFAFSNELAVTDTDSVRSPAGATPALKPRLAIVEMLPNTGNAEIDASRVEKPAVGGRVVATTPVRSLTVVNGNVGVTKGMGSPLQWLVVTLIETMT
jgi:hypothetical protein